MGRRDLVRAIVAGACVLGCGAGGHPQPSAGGHAATAEANLNAQVTWTISVREGFTLDEHVCWRGFRPSAVKPESNAGIRFASAGDPAHPITANGVAVAGDAGCIDVVVDLDKMASDLADESAVTHVGRAIVGSFDPWLWRPEPWPEGMRGQLTIAAPKGVLVSLPHERVRGGDGSFVVPYSTWSFMARFAIGRASDGMSIDERDAAGTHLSIVTLPEATTTASRDGIRRFVEGAAAAVATIDDEHSQMATDRVQVLLRAGGRGRQRDPVQFGMAMRGGGPAVTLHISPTASDDALFGEWITVHELSHLWLPPVDRDGAWMSEGLASYYQCVLRSRVKMYDEKVGWTELLEGFARGQRQAGSLPLKDARRPSFQHIYWGGAAIGLKLDVLLRTHGSSLDHAVTALRRSMDDSEDRPAAEMVAMLLAKAKTTRSLADVAPNGDVAALVRSWLERPFPDTSSELAALGITMRSDGVVLDDKAPLASVRKAIAGAR